MKSLIALLVLITVPAVSSAYTAHEWGTFTGVQGSDGRSVNGLWREEELLPGFVQGRGSCEFTKCADFLIQPEGPFSVNQKLETPVLYFYSSKAEKVSVKVDFPQGLVTQYYPNATKFSPPRNQVQAVAGGSTTWDVEISMDVLPIPSVSSGNVYSPARETNGNFIRVGNENEKFIFYRGLGRFEIPFQVKSVGKTLTIKNLSQETVPAIFLARLENGRGEVETLKALAPGQSVNVPAPTVTEQSPLEPQYLEKAKKTMVAALIHTGLYGDEAEAMFNTWKKSYFVSPGLKVLYIASPKWTEALLPLEMKPTPEKLVRTLIGRVEVILADEEVALLKSFENAMQNGLPIPVENLGRFAEPKIRRVLQINTNPALEQWVHSQFAFDSGI